MSPLPLSSSPAYAGLPRGRFHSSSSRPQELVGGMIGVLGGAIIGGIAGRVLGPDIEMAVGMAIGAGLGLITGLTVGHTARLGAERTYQGDAIDLLGHGLLDEDGNRIGRVVSVYLDEEDPKPVYLGISTTWLPFAMPHLVPMSALGPVADSRAVQIATTARVVRTAPSFPLDATIYGTDEEEIAQHYAPHGIRDRRWWRSLDAMSQSPAGERRRRLQATHRAQVIIPELVEDSAGDELEVAITLAFSGDAPYAQTAPQYQDSDRRSQSAGPSRTPRPELPPVAMPARRSSIQSERL